MAQVISATALGAYRGGAGAGAARPSAHSPEEFLNKARVLLAQAARESERGRGDEALECAYRCSLRVAGAVLAAREGGRRRRGTASAWARLGALGARERRWAEEFQSFSRLRSRLNSGLESRVDDAVVRRLLLLVSEFLGEVEGDVLGVAAAA